MPNTLKNKTKHTKLLNAGVIVSLLPHLFCCVLPLVLATVGLIAPGTAHWHIVPHSWEPWLFLFSGAMLVLSWIILLCHSHHCHGDKCERTNVHRNQKIILWVITGVFVIGLVVYICTHGHH